MKKMTISGTILLCAHLALADEQSSPASTPAPDKSQYTLFNPTPIDSRRAYNTDRPSKTDSPFTVDAGVFQIESDVANWTLDYENGVRTRTWIAGNTNFKLGLTNSMSLSRSSHNFMSTRAQAALVLENR